jgi:DNA-binding transcriptional LysR family regulator
MPRLFLSITLMKYANIKNILQKSTQMNLKQLEAIVQVAKNGSLSKASSSMGLAQSIVSRYVGQLELAWGDRVFERTGRGMTLTEFGISVLPEVEALLEQARRLDEAISGAAGVPSGMVRVGIVPSLASAIVPALSSDLHAHAPKVKLSIIEGLGSRLDELLISGRIDVAVVNRYADNIAEGEDLVGQVKTYLVFNKSHKFGNLKAVKFSQLKNIPLVLPPAPSGLRTILDSYAKNLGFEIDVHMEAESLSVMKEVAILGEAMTILPLCAISNEIKLGKLIAREVLEPALPRKILIAVTNQHAISKAARFVMGRLHRIIPPLLKL